MNIIFNWNLIIIYELSDESLFVILHYFDAIIDLKFINTLAYICFLQFAFDQILKLNRRNKSENLDKNIVFLFIPLQVEQ